MKVEFDSQDIEVLKYKANRYDAIKTEITELYLSEDEHVDLVVIGEKICSMLGFYG